jgi:hypothetical protein
MALCYVGTLANDGSLFRDDTLWQYGSLMLNGYSRAVRLALFGRYTL